MVGRRQSASGLKLAGSLILVAVIQFILLMTVSEALYPHYSVSANYISDLGVGTTAPIFNTSIALLGVAVVAAAYLMRRGLGSMVFSVLVALAGIGAICIGVFNESFGMLHTYVSVWTFLFGAFAMLYSVRITRWPLGYLSAPLGLLSLFSLAMLGFFPQAFGLGVGGFERLVVYPFLLWGLALGGYMLGLASRGDAQEASSNEG